MGKDSAYYISLAQKRRKDTDTLKYLLPQYAHGFVDECLLKYQLSTVFNYTQDIYFFYRFLKENNPLCKNFEIKDIPFEVIENLSHQDINEFQVYIAKGHKPTSKGIKPAEDRAIARKMAALRRFYKYLLDNDYLRVDPTLKAVKKSKTEPKKKEIRRLRPDQVMSLMDSVKSVNSESYHSRVMSEVTAKRDLAIITLLLNTGIRVSECAGLDLTDIDFEENKLAIVRKGGYEDHLYFKKGVKDALTDYIDNERPSLLNGEKSEALFISLKHCRMSVRSIQYMIAKYGKNTGLSEKLTPHKLRRTYGTALYNKTSDIYMVADVLGHKDVNTTINHYVDIEEEHKKKASNVDIYGMDDVNKSN